MVPALPPVLNARSTNVPFYVINGHLFSVKAEGYRYCEQNGVEIGGPSAENAVVTANTRSELRKGCIVHTVVVYGGIGIVYIYISIYI